MAVTKYTYDSYPEVFQTILEKMKQCVPGVQMVEIDETSDGTIKLFTYLVLLHDPVQHALMCIEKPENQLYPVLLETLAEEFCAYTESDGQVFVSTHSPDLNAVDIEEVFYLEKVDGFTKIKKVSDNALSKSLYEAGDPLGALWKQGLLTEE